MKKKKKWGFNHMPGDDAAAALNCDSGGAFRAVGLLPVK